MFLLIKCTFLHLMDERKKFPDSSAFRISNMIWDLLMKIIWDFYLIEEENQALVHTLYRLRQRFQCSGSFWILWKHPMSVNLSKKSKYLGIPVLYGVIPVAFSMVLWSLYSPGNFTEIIDDIYYSLEICRDRYSDLNAKYVCLYIEM